jgi:hypothetical protein
MALGLRPLTASREKEYVDFVRRRERVMRDRTTMWAKKAERAFRTGDPILMQETFQQAASMGLDIMPSFDRRIEKLMIPRLLRLMQGSPDMSMVAIIDQIKEEYDYLFDERANRAANSYLQDLNNKPKSRADEIFEEISK